MTAPSLPPERTTALRAALERAAQLGHQIDPEREGYRQTFWDGGVGGVQYACLHVCWCVIRLHRDGRIDGDALTQRCPYGETGKTGKKRESNQDDQEKKDQDKKKKET